MIDATASPSLPRVIQDSLCRFAAFLASVSVAFGRSGDRKRAMRSDRRDNITKVVEIMLYGCSLQFDGIICHFERLWVRPKTIPEIARLAGLSVATVARCLADLIDLGLLESRQIRRKNKVTGQFEVSYGLRSFTQKFWESMGLWEKIKAGMEWAKKHGRRKFILPFKGINRKVQTTAKQVGNSVMSFLSDLKKRANPSQIGTADFLNLLPQRK